MFGGIGEVLLLLWFGLIVWSVVKFVDAIRRARSK